MFFRREAKFKRDVKAGGITNETVVLGEGKQRVEEFLSGDGLVGSAQFSQLFHDAASARWCTAAQVVRIRWKDSSFKRHGVGG